MNLFRTVFPPIKWDFKIDYPSSHFLMGSCFSEHIGKRLERSKFDSSINPFGILFHPEAIARVLNRIIDNTPYTENDLLAADARYISFDHHGSFNHADKKTMLSAINMHFQSAYKDLKKADVIYITWGTSNGYSYLKENKIVSNCHKIPSDNFEKKQSTSNEIVASYNSLFSRLNKFNPNVKIIISVSPVKHLKDGIHENNLSKANLLLAANQLVSTHSNTYYFPSFELMQDDLRDYRFYTKDMTHPNEMAVDYIWEYFKDNAWTDNAKALYKRIDTLQLALEHRPLHPENEAHQVFLKETMLKIKKIEAEFSFLSFKA